MQDADSTARASEYLLSGDVARLAGVSTETVRGWERAGKLAATRTDGGARLFRRVDVLAFPEMVITGYPPEDLLLKPSFIEKAIARTRDLLPHTAGMTVIVGTVDRDVDLYNAAAVLHDGRWVGSYRKRYLTNYGVFDENRYFMSGTRNPVFVRDGTVIGLSICEDIWYAGGPLYLKDF